MVSGAKPGFLLFLFAALTVRTPLVPTIAAQPTISLTDAQPECSSTPAWSTCDILFDLELNDKTTGPLQLRAEFRSPHHRTYLMYAFQDSARRFIIRVAPTEAG